MQNVVKISSAIFKLRQAAIANWTSYSNILMYCMPFFAIGPWPCMDVWLCDTNNASCVKFREFLYRYN